MTPNDVTPPRTAPPAFDPFAPGFYTYYGLISTAALILCVWLKPAFVDELLIGLVLGLGYHISLMWIGKLGFKVNRRALPVIMMGCSFLRIILFALVAVWVGHGRLPETTIVIAGLFGYKWVLLLRAFEAFLIKPLWQRFGRKANIQTHPTSTLSG